MNNGSSHIKTRIAKTLIIILGVIIAFIMTYNSQLFSAENEHTVQSSNTALHEAHLQEESSNALNYNSGTRLLNVFTRNLPYLNSK